TVGIEPPEWWRHTALFLAEAFGHIGAWRLAAEAAGPPSPGLTPHERAAISALMWERKSQAANLKGIPVGPSAEQARAAGSLENLPLIVLSAGLGHQGVPTEAQQINVELHGELAQRSTRGRQVVVWDSGHMIPFEEPEAVIEAVREIVDEVRCSPDN